MKNRISILIAILLLSLLLIPSAGADPCPMSTDGTHHWSDWLVVVPPCVNEGLRTRTCECGAMEEEAIPATGHHDWGEWFTTLEPTCTTDGERVRYCHCQASETETIPALGHTPVSAPDVAATCTSDGKTGGTQCAVCGAVLAEPAVIPATGHTPVPIPAVAATCTEAGNTEGSQCAVCGAILSEPAAIPAHGHTWSEWEEVSPGKKERTCKWCGETQEKIQEAAGLRLASGKTTRLDPADGYTDVYQVDMTLENTGTIPLELKLGATYGDGDPGEFAEVITDEIVGIDYYNPGTIQPGETISFQYLARTNGMYTDGEKKVITRLVFARGTSENPAAQVTAVQPIVINLPAEDGLLLTVDNMHRSGSGADEVITFDLTVTNQVTGWSLVSVSAKDYMGQQRDGDEFTGWPEEGLLLGYGQSYTFSLSIRPSAEELGKVTENNPNAWIGRYVTVQDLQGHSAEANVTAKLQTPQTAETFLDGEMEKPDHLCSNEAASIPVSLTLRNIGDIPVTDPVVKGVLMTGGCKTVGAYTLTPENGVSVLQPGESTAFSLTVPVGQEEESAALEDGENILRFVFWAEHSYDDPEKGPSHGESNMWQQAIGVWELTLEDPRSSYIAPVLTASFEDKVYQAGEKVMINLRVDNVNPEDTIEGIRFEWCPVDGNGEIGEPLVADRPDAVLAPGEFYELANQFYYSIGEEEAAEGVVILDFVAWCHSATYDWTVNCGWHGMIHMKAD